MFKVCTNYLALAML